MHEYRTRVLVLPWSFPSILNSPVLLRGKQYYKFIKL